ncbi:MAG: hypothetical protein PUF50_03045 [Erysipelotrichaceae bacterium]|nr:hypothetical protein [Erysipelotrichaceae bacterium]
MDLNKAIRLRENVICKLKIKNDELVKHTHRLEDMISSLMCENIELKKSLCRERKVNDSLVKHSHILFDALYKSQKKNSKHVAVKPTLDDLEDIFKDVLP